MRHLVTKEFFDRKRFGSSTAKLSSYSHKRPLLKKHPLSQDLLALHTVSKAHSTNRCANIESRQIRSVDLDKFQSCTRTIGDIDLGPSSPCQTPSKLLLLEARHARKNEAGQPRSAHIHSGHPLTHGRRPSPQESVQTPEPCCDSVSLYGQKQPIYKNENDDSFLFSKPKMTRNKLSLENSNSIPKVVYSSSECRDKESKSKSKLFHLDPPYVSEDFQATPLRKYAKMSSAALNYPCDNEVQATVKEVSRKSVMPTHPGAKIDGYYTSTPQVDDKTVCSRSDLMKMFGNPVSTLVSESAISPIKRPKLIPENDTEFRYLPRPTGTPVKKHCHDISNATRSPSLKSSQMLSLEIQNNLEVSDDNTSTTSTGKIIRKNHPDNYDDFDTFKSKSLSRSSHASSKTVLTQSQVHVGDSLSQEQVKSQSSWKIDSQLANSSSPTFRYTKPKTFRSNESVGNSSGSELVKKEETKDTDFVDDSVNVEDVKQPSLAASLGVEKPLALDAEEDFHYTPFKTQRSSVSSPSYVMKMYGREELFDKEEDRMLISCNKTAQSHVFGEIRKDGSPRTADEFPYDLNMMDMMSAVDDEAVVPSSAGGLSRRKVNCSDGDSTPSSRETGRTETEEQTRDRTEHPGSDMEEVLKELSQLEKQDSEYENAPETVTCVSHYTTEVLEDRGPPPASEVDRYLESEELVWAGCCSDNQNDEQPVSDQAATPGATKHSVPTEQIVAPSASSVAMETDDVTKSGLIEHIQEKATLENLTQSQTSVQDHDEAESCSNSPINKLSEDVVCTQVKDADLLVESPKSVGENILKDTPNSDDLKLSQAEQIASKVFTDSSTSPIVFKQETQSIGIQCQLYDRESHQFLARDTTHSSVPTLGQIVTGTLLQVKPVVQRLQRYFSTDSELIDKRKHTGKDTHSKEHEKEQSPQNTGEELPHKVQRDIEPELDPDSVESKGSSITKET